MTNNFGLFYSFECVLTRSGVTCLSGHCTVMKVRQLYTSWILSDRMTRISNIDTATAVIVWRIFVNECFRIMTTLQTNSNAMESKIEGSLPGQMNLIYFANLLV